MVEVNNSKLPYIRDEFAKACNFMQDMLNVKSNEAREFLQQWPINIVTELQKKIFRIVSELEFRIASSKADAECMKKAYDSFATIKKYDLIEIIEGIQLNSNEEEPCAQQIPYLGVPAKSEKELRTKFKHKIVPVRCYDSASGKLLFDNTYFIEEFLDEKLKQLMELSETDKKLLKAYGTLNPIIIDDSKQMTTQDVIKEKLDSELSNPPEDDPLPEDEINSYIGKDKNDVEIDDEDLDFEPSFEEEVAAMEQLAQNDMTCYVRDTIKDVGSPSVYDEWNDPKTNPISKADNNESKAT